MSDVTCDLSVSVDGYVAGPDQSHDDPIGRGGLRLHEWHFDAQGEDARIVEEWQGGVGAYVMGRNMFGWGRGEWDLDWTGWWGEEPPYGVPVFVLTHHPRESVEVGATTFHFVTEGVEVAVARAREVGGGPDGRGRGWREHRQPVPRGRAGRRAAPARQPADAGGGGAAVRRRRSARPRAASRWSPHPGSRT